MNLLSSPAGNELLASFFEPLRKHLRQVDADLGVRDSFIIAQLNSELSMAKDAHKLAADEVLNDIFVLERLVMVFDEYGVLWHQLATTHFSESWMTLQNTLDGIRVVRRFSKLGLHAIAGQLSALETLYPYNVFFSVGVCVQRFECSICGNDIDSFDCIHRRGELYRGEMAIAIARNIVQMDHLAMVDQPADKRCVVAYSDTAKAFDVVRYLSDLVSSRKLTISCFAGAIWGKRRVPNPAHQTLGRNAPCYCGSGTKFKKCCVDNAFAEQDHVEIVPSLSIIERAVA